MEEMRPNGPPIGLHLAATAKAVSRAFNGALAEVGGSLPTWLILTSLRGERWRTQQELARSLGIEGPTLTRHLDSLERAGLVERRRDPSDRRAVQVELTKAGESLHSRLRTNVIAFDQQLRAGFGEAELKRLRATLRKLEENVTQREPD
jgi:MarR family transcriptional regulator, transcriptional regulator for hemolysin